MRLYDDQTEPNLTNALPDKGGFSQSGPEEGPNGFLDVEEKVRLTWTDLDDDTRAAILRDLAKLSRKAALTNKPERPEYYDRNQAVVWEQQTPTESEPRYTVVKSIRSPSLAAKHGASGGPLNLTLNIEREGLWRGIRPGAAGTAVISEAVQNYTYSTSRNYVTIAPSAIPGDAPALARIRITTSGTAGSRLWLMRRKSVSLTSLNNFNPYFWMASAASPPTTTTATAVQLNGYSPAAIPGDRLHDGTQIESGTYVYWWNIDEKLADYAGNFNVWGIYRADTAQCGTLRIDHGWGTGNQESSLGPVLFERANTMEYWDYLYLGTIKMPPGGMIEGVAPAFYGSYQLRTLIGGVDATPRRAQVAGFFLQPLDDMVYQADQVGYQIADSDIRRSWKTNSAGTTFASANLKAEGDYIELEPGFYNRIYINSLPGFFAMGTTYTITISIIPMYQYLRGAETW